MYHLHNKMHVLVPQEEESFFRFFIDIFDNVSSVQEKTSCLVIHFNLELFNTREITQAKIRLLLDFHKRNFEHFHAIVSCLASNSHFTCRNCQNKWHYTRHTCSICEMKYFDFIVCLINSRNIFFVNPGDGCKNGFLISVDSLRVIF